MRKKDRADRHDIPQGTAGERLMSAADDLFYNRGIRAVGVDEIVKQAGVAKVSLYRAYSSKDDLIVDYLRGRDAEFWRSWDAAIATASSPGDRLRAVIDFLREALSDPNYRGCPFANFAAEFPERGHGGRAIVEASKAELRRRLIQLCGEMRLREPRQVAEGLFLMIEGAFAASQTAPPEERSTGNALEWAVQALVSAQEKGVD